MSGRYKTVVIMLTPGCMRVSWLQTIGEERACGTNSGGMGQVSKVASLPPNQ